MIRTILLSRHYKMIFVTKCRFLRIKKIRILDLKIEQYYFSTKTSTKLFCFCVKCYRIFFSFKLCISERLPPPQKKSLGHQPLLPRAQTNLEKCAIKEAQLNSTFRGFIIKICIILWYLDSWIGVITPFQHQTMK